MEMKSYAVSIQWGKGPHYFIWTGAGAADALAIAEAHKNRLEKQQRYGKPRATVFTWFKVSEKSYPAKNGVDNPQLSQPLTGA